MRVAAVQFRPEFKNVRRNLKVLVDLVNTAIDAGARLIVLPELATTGYSLMGAEEAEPLAEIVTKFDPATLTSNSSMNIFYALASKRNVYIVWGLVEKDQGTGSLHNSQVIMCPNGMFEVMRKINSFGQDFLWSTPGRANPPIIRITDKGKEYKVGLLLCRDIRDKKDDNWKSFYEKGDADIVAFSANWGKGAFPATAWMEFVKDNGAALVVSNRWGKEANNDFGDGGVCVIHPSGKVQCDGLIWGQDCIVYGEI